MLSNRFLLTLRNEIIALVKNCTTAKRMELLGNNRFHTCLDLLDPELPNHTDDAEEASLAFHNALRMIGLYKG